MKNTWGMLCYKHITMKKHKSDKLEKQKTDRNWSLWEGKSVVFPWRTGRFSTRENVKHYKNREDMQFIILVMWILVNYTSGQLPHLPLDSTVPTMVLCGSQEPEGCQCSSDLMEIDCRAAGIRHLSADFLPASVVKL